jgi:UPF0716 protein FxsA
MLRWLFVLLLLLPIAELVVLIQLGQQIGFWRTVALIVGAGIAGVWVIKWQGARTVQKAALSGLSGGAQAMFSGVLLTVAGVLLLIPGVITDGLALLLLLPFTRQALSAWVLRKGMVGVMGAFGPGLRGRFTGFGHAGAAAQTSSEDSIFEGEFTRDDAASPPQPPAQPEATVLPKPSQD